MKKEKLVGCKHKPSGVVCLVAHHDGVKCDWCKKCGRYYRKKVR